MAICVMTGGSTGIGAATRKKLLDAGHEVFNIDYKGGDFDADLSTSEGCKNAIAEVFRRYPDGIDVMICNAGVGPTAPIPTILITSFVIILNYIPFLILFNVLLVELENVACCCCAGCTIV